MDKFAVGDGVISLSTRVGVAVIDNDAVLCSPSPCSRLLPTANASAAVRIARRHRHRQIRVLPHELDDILMSSVDTYTAVKIRCWKRVWE